MWSGDAGSKHGAMPRRKLKTPDVQAVQIQSSQQSNLVTWSAHVTFARKPVSLDHSEGAGADRHVDNHERGDQPADIRTPA